MTKIGVKTNGLWVFPTVSKMLWEMINVGQTKRDSTHH